MQLSIVSYLDEAATKEVRALQEKVAEITGSKASLDSWQPHITTGDGVEVDTDDELQSLIENIKRFAAENGPFDITSHEFGARNSRPVGVGEVSTPYVLELKVDVNEKLDGTVTELGGITAKYRTWYKMPVPYHPHVTIAFRDLDEKGYHTGAAYLAQKQIAIKSQINHIALVEKLPEKDVEYARFALSTYTPIS